MKVRMPKKAKQSYLTPGKVYNVIEGSSSGNGFRIYNDLGGGCTSYCLFKKCAHLRGMDWEVINESSLGLTFINWLLKDFPAQPAGPVTI